MSGNQKKKSSTTEMKELIREKHPDAWLIESVSLESESKADGYGAFTQDKLFIYKLSPEKKLMLINTMNWPEGKSGQVDHFAIKSYFSIDGINLTIANHGKDLQLFLEEQKKDTFTKITRPFYRKIIGFRSKKIGKMVVASFIYLLFIIPFIIGLLGGIVSGIGDITFASKEELQKSEQLLAITEKEADTLKKQIADKDKEIGKLTKLLSEKEKEVQELAAIGEQQKAESQAEIERLKQDMLKKEQAEAEREVANVAQSYTSQQQSPPKNEYYKNCTELRKVYPQGVAANHPAYASKHDRDKDGWACER
ncbi:excalibur calcium-binding domain-containing protein [Lysinibacillus piscis]|uniref:Excalibur calcium-binding domain-containing protein n=1 Tax=Lysinibacillus piscis TaxID=2518931 RepID=A0ABQ5NLT4_9BACI|nr:excalibur calcium-binding domain-containing protein [Lysinibacillus sp. KH24]GLC89311.1 hypothetical protein LYSBPC_24380 [Lysinibacillus sp. KH24]